MILQLNVRLKSTEKLGSKKCNVICIIGKKVMYRLCIIRSIFFCFWDAIMCVVHKIQFCKHFMIVIKM